MSLRFRHRHVHKTLFEHLKSGLADLGWTGANGQAVPFGTTPITMVDYQPEDRGEPIAPNTVSVTMGNELADVEEELGATLGGLHSVDVPVFVDIYGVEQAIAVSIASDVKDLLKNAYLTVYDWSTDPATDSGERLEMSEVLGPERPAGSLTGAENLKRNWRVVKGLATTYFQG